MKHNIYYTLLDFLQQAQLPLSYQHLIIKHLYHLDINALLLNEDLLDKTILDDFIKTYQKKSIPIPYLCGFCYFYNQEYSINQACLIPRIESECLVAYILNDLALNNQALTILDLCCGSGVLGISVYNHLTIKPQLICSDISNQALEICCKNLKKYHINAQVLQGDMLQPLFDNQLKPDVIIINPPYVPTSRILDYLVLQEPQNAIYSGVDGFDAYRVFFKQLSGLNHPCVIYGEIDPSQISLCQAQGINTFIKDIEGVKRFFKYNYEPQSN